MASNRGYDVIVDVDTEGDLGHTDLHEDNLEFHSSNFANPANSKGGPLPSSAAHSNPNAPKQSANASGKRFLWSLSFYAHFFDVDTGEVLRRCQAAIFPRRNFLDVLDGNPDLYGPVWIATTVVVILFLTGTFSAYLQSRGKDHYGYDFKLLSGAAGLIYGYTSVIPLALFLALKYSGSEAANALELWALYGYANVIWIPVALISWSPIDVLNYVFVGLGLAMSALFLVRNLHPIISTTPHQRARALLIIVLILHAGLAVAIKVLFFAYKSPASKGNKGGKKQAGSGGTGEGDGNKGSGGGGGDDTDTDDDESRRRRMLAFGI